MSMAPDVRSYLCVPDPKAPSHRSHSKRPNYLRN
jgi:hypothetical protein